MRDAHAGVGLALLVGRCIVMGLRRGFAAVIMGVYVDAHGEEEEEEEDRGRAPDARPAGGCCASAPRAPSAWVARLWASQRLAGRGGGARLAQDRIAHANFF